MKEQPKTMKRECAKRNTVTRRSGKATKRSKRMVYEEDDNYIPTSPTRNVTVKSKRLTRAYAATIRTALVQLPDDVLEPKKCTINTGPPSVSPKLNVARSPVLTNNEDSTDKGKQPAEEFTDENASNGKQDSHQSTNLLARYAESQTKSQHDSLDACEHAESLARNPALSSSTEKHLSAIVLRKENEGQEVMHLLEMTPVMDHGPLDDAEQFQTIPNISPSTVAKEINEKEAPEGHSIHMTEMAAMTDNIQLNDDEEAESVDQTLICVGGYLVRKEIAPLLREIIDKHKDIADGCKLEKRKGRVPFLEMICDICQKIRDKSLSDVDPGDLNDMVTTVKVIQNAGFNVKWLLERLKAILEAKRLGKECRAFKRKYTELDLLLEKKNKLTAQLSAVEAEFSTKKSEVDNEYPNYNNRLKNLRLKGFRQWSESLLNGLI